MKKFFTFIYFRIIVYFLSFISYNNNLFNIKKLELIIQNKELFYKYIKKYKLNITVLIVILICASLGLYYLNSRLKKGKVVCIEVSKIEGSN